MITSKQLRQKYIDFFKSKGHAEIPSASLIPENDPSILFTTAGMSPLAPFLLGEKHPAGKRLVNSQKCVRTSDIDEVGDGFHHTFFEMLGHWSLGDYFKKEAIEMSFEFLTQYLSLPKEKLAFSVFAGDENAPRDEDAADAWKNFGVSEKRISYLSKSDNWWELAGNSGPCGPCTEMFYWSDNNETAPEVFNPKDKRWMEIGNDVLMQYEKIGEGKYKTASQKNIDNGTGLERILAAMNDLDDNYKTDLFWPIIEKIKGLSGKKYDFDKETIRSMRIIADHLRAATFIMGDDFGVAPSNTDQGYVVRRLIRRAIRHGRTIGIKENFTDKVAEVIINLMSDIYSELMRNKKFILENLQLEEEKFTKTLQGGLNEFKRFAYIAWQKDNNGNIDFKHRILEGKIAFDFYQTYGFPLELIKEVARDENIKLGDDFDNEFNDALKKHQELSRTAANVKFKGGLANQSEMAIKYHTTTHLILATLRKVLGEHVFQRGSNITAERLRLDFSHSEKMTSEQIAQVEKIVNEQIQKNLPVECAEMSLSEAKDAGAMGVFENKYGERVKVYTIGEPNNYFSREICGGPHVKNIGELGHFRIVKEEASSAGVRRIKAVLE